MSSIVATILLARNGEPGNGGWMQLIVFVILGLIYVLGGLAKMKANKTAEDTEEDKPAEEPKRQPRYKPLDGMAPPRYPEARRTTAPEVSRTTPRPVRQIRRPADVPARREHRRVVAQGLKPPKRPTKPATKPPLSKIKKPIPSLESLEPVVSYELGKIEKLGVDLSRGQKEEDMVLAGRPALNYQDPDALREAIVHYEILGKPLSLREPGQHMWEL